LRADLNGTPFGPSRLTPLLCPRACPALFPASGRWGCFALLVHASASQAQASEEKQLLARFEKQVDELRGRLRIPGMSAAIIKDQKVVWAKGFGFADAESRVPATPDTVYHIASFTKPFAATLVMQLVEQGKLDLVACQPRNDG